MFQDKLLAKMEERDPDTALDDDEEVRCAYDDGSVVLVAFSSLARILGE